MKRLGFILLILIVFYFIFLIRQDTMDNLELRKAEKKIKENTRQEEELAEELQNRLKLLKQRDYIEELARTRLGLVKKGEKAYKAINDE